MLSRLHLGLPKCSASLIAGLALAGCDGGSGQTLPEGVSAADVTLFKSTVAVNGCAVSNPAQAADIESKTGFSGDKLRSITQYLTLTGESEPAATGFRLTSGQCANA